MLNNKPMNEIEYSNFRFIVIAFNNYIEKYNKMCI